MKTILKNRWAIGFAIFHAIVVFVVFLIKNPQQGFGYHFAQETLYYRLLFWVDFPSIVLTGILFYPFVGSGEDSTSVVVAVYYAVLLGLTSFQWLLIGHIFSKWLFRGKMPV